MKISCEQASSICNKAQYEEASFWEKIKLKLHLAYCKKCAKYTKKNTQLSALCNNAKLHALSERDKAAMKELLDKKL